MPPRLATTNTRLPVSRPSTWPSGVYRTVRWTRMTWSSHALSVEGMEKLYIGAPITMTSAASASAISVSESATAAACAGVRRSGSVARPVTRSAVIWGAGLAARSRLVTAVSGWTALQAATNAWETAREADASPRMLLSMWSRRCMGQCPVEGVVEAPWASGHIGDRCCIDDTCRISLEWLATLTGAMGRWWDLSTTRQRSGNVAEQAGRAGHDRSQGAAHAAPSARWVEGADARAQLWADHGGRHRGPGDG